MTARGAARRALRPLLLCLPLAAALGASDTAARFDQDSHQLMCVCGCNELLGECNHMDCPDSPVMRAELSASLARGDSDDAILHQFQGQYGPAVLAAPRFTRFNHLAWIVPPLALFLGVGATLLIVRKWKMDAVPMPSAPNIPDFGSVRDRVRRETQL